jgi:tRNA(fMet)-specific endonuclease VapC
VKFLLDTNVCSEYLRGKAPVTLQVRQNINDCSISTISAAELFVWGFRAKSSTRWLPSVESFLQGIPLHDVTLEVGRLSGSLRASRLDQGQQAPLQDLLIAATALVHGLTLITHNVGDFQNIPGLYVVDWQV